MTRHEYVVSRDGYHVSGRSLPAHVAVRPPEVADQHGLALLMMDAYLGTIDYEGETPEQALDEVRGYFETGALVTVSRVAVNSRHIESAALVSDVGGIPIAGYIMTRAELKNRGIASGLLDIVAGAVWADGYPQLRAFITAGNVASEIIFKRAGFEVVGSYEESD